MITHRLFDAFNRRVCSRHKSLRAAVIAQAKLSRAVKRANGPKSYLPTIVEYLAGDEWIKVPTEDVHGAEYAAGIR